MKNFIVYKSSAGSGKTFTLVKEYLRLALYDENKLDFNYKRILAVTFTNKAAAEMKTRIVESLNTIANEDKTSTLKDLLLVELNVSDDDLKHRAKTVLGSILHHYSDFSVGTIDSFTHRIVKTFAHDLDLPVNFNIELDTEGFYEKVIAMLFNKVGEDEYISKLLKEYALTKAEDNASWDPEQHIQDFSRLLLKEHSGNYLDQLKQFDANQLDELRKQFIDFIYYYKNTLKTEAQQALDLIKKNGLDDIDFTYKKSGPQGFFRKCLTATVDLADISGARIKDAVEKNKWADKNSERALVVESIIPELNKLAAKLIDFIREHYTYFSLCELLGKQMYPLMLLKKIEEISLEQKQEERLVFISEFNQKIFDIINNEPTPFIYERLGERYRHYLLDEFQDTSSLQWHNILPLLDNSLANGWFNLIVGDGKQSIYRWRNANVKQFAGLPLVDNPSQSEAINERASNLLRNFQAKILNTNYRSSKKIVEFNNSLFEYLSTKLLPGEFKNIYTDHAQIAQNSTGGYVTVHAGVQERDQIDQYTLNTIQEKIKQALSDGFAYGDICVLARRNFHGNTVADFLLRNKIPVVSSDSLLLKYNLEINTVLSYLRHLINKQDYVSAASVINYLFQTQQITEAEFHEDISSLSKGESLFSIFKKHNVDLAENELSLNNLFDNCVDFIKALQINKTGYQHIRFFLDEINEFLVLKNSNITSFFDWWESRSNKASMIIPEGTNAVKIMTIHASKGLEFPVVIVPYCNWGIYKAGDNWVNIKNERVKLPVSVVNLSKKAAESGFEQELETEKQEQVLDNLNLLYVAFTRAIERLHIISALADTNRQESVSAWLENYFKENPTSIKEGTHVVGIPERNRNSHSQSNDSVFELWPLNFDTNKDTIRIKASYLNNHEETEYAKKQGIMIHWLLSKIKTAADIDRALELGLLEGLFKKEDMATLADKLRNITAEPNLLPFFREGNNSRSETELITQMGEVLRPDRIVLENNSALLLDYKTGKEHNEKYFQQLLKYETALLSMGYTGIKKFLVYTDEVSVVEVK